MTGQISDTIIYKGENYDLIGIKGELISPKKFGMSTKVYSTGCWRGFYATYEITEAGLRLRTLTLSEKDNKYQPINNIRPEKGTWGEATYNNLDVNVPFSGTIRLAKDFIWELYIHMGYQKPTAFKTVYEITLEDGRVVKLQDKSKEMEEKRGAFKKAYETDGRTIADAFSLNMELE
ncbi:MAG: hypothetical protein CL875_04515 [Dehalococcoidales bacterium]|nr:hypothetical protein [Dehalococcoidales bacterium]|tara:strand:- start:144 stop:674 length:531 start_codon:yes stop_codon:yes gene_type:complete